MKKIPKRFLEFLQDIANDGDWEYEDGASMTEDAKITLEILTTKVLEDASTRTKPRTGGQQ